MKLKTGLEAFYASKHEMDQVYSRAHRASNSSRLTTHFDFTKMKYIGLKILTINSTINR